MILGVTAKLATCPVLLSHSAGLESTLDYEMRKRHTCIMTSSRMMGVELADDVFLINSGGRDIRKIEKGECVSDLLD